MIIRSQAYPRAGLIGNSSDGYFGKTMAFGDHSRFENMRQLVNDVLLTPGKNNEIQLTDALRLMVKTRAVYGLRFDGVRYDIGNKLDFIKTNIIFGLKRDDMRTDLLAFLQKIAGSM
jgi:UTP-glucose-1-phosphate uridylyltransferase